MLGGKDKCGTSIGRQTSVGREIIVGKEMSFY